MKRLALLLPLTVLVFGNVFHYDFVQDDWYELARLVPNPTAYLIEAFLPGAHHFFRPFIYVSQLIIYKLFGLQAVGFHCVNLAVHAISACLVGKIGDFIFENRALSWVAALVYAAAAPVNLIPFFWMQGLNQLGGQCFALLSVLCFLRGHQKRAALFYLVATGFREPFAFLPAVFLAWSVLMRRFSWSAFRPVAIAAVFYFSLRLIFSRWAALPEQAPYHMELMGLHVVKNAYVYLRLLVYSLAPVTDATFTTKPFLIFGASVFLAAFGGYALARRLKTGAPLSSPVMLWLGFWVIWALVPAVFLKNFNTPYYAQTAFVPFVFLATALVDLLVRSVLRGVLARHAVLFMFAGFSVACSFFYFERRLDKWATETEGVVYRAVVSRTVRRELERQLPQPPKGSTIVVSGVNVWAFYKDAGPRLWYADPSLRVFDGRFLKAGENGWAIVNSNESLESRWVGLPEYNHTGLDSSKTFVFQWRDTGRYGALDRITLPTLQTGSPK